MCISASLNSVLYGQIMHMPCVCATPVLLIFIEYITKTIIFTAYDSFGFLSSPSRTLSSPPKKKKKKKIQITVSFICICLLHLIIHYQIGLYVYFVSLQDQGS